MTRCARATWGDYIWLAYSVFFFVEPLLRNDFRYWLECSALFAVFVVIYVLNVNVRGSRTQLVCLAAMVACGVVGVPFNIGSLCFFTFAAAFLPFTLTNTPLVIGLLVADAAIASGEAALVRMNWINVLMPLFMIAVVGTSNIFIAQKKNANRRLSMAQNEIERLAALAERERIARDMHDVLGHTLSVIVLKSELARRLLEQHAPAPGHDRSELALATAEIAEVEHTARTALAEVRKAITGYRSEGLSAELELARRTLRTAGVELTVDVRSKAAVAELAATEETVLSLAVREAVINIVRHAEATACTIALFQDEHGAHQLVVEDNGRGGTVREGNGLRGMRERLEALGGELVVEENTGSPRTPRSGTALHITLPPLRPAPLPQSAPASAAQA